MKSTLFLQIVTTMKFGLFSGVNANKFSIVEFKKIVNRICCIASCSICIYNVIFELFYKMCFHGQSFIVCWM